MKHLNILAIALALSTASHLGHADEFNDASLQLCEKFKSCALKKMDQQNLTPDMRQMMEPMLASICEGMKQSYGIAIRHQQLYTPATACMQSMQKLPCSALEADHDTRTPECQAFEKATANYQ